jgi:hypothetical protein
MLLLIIVPGIFLGPGALATRLILDARSDLKRRSQRRSQQETQHQFEAKYGSKGTAQGTGKVSELARQRSEGW